MSADAVCRVCLVNNINLFCVRNDLQNIYERLTGEKYNVGHPVRMCYICLTVLRKCHRFMETARDTNNVLKQWHNQQNEIIVARPLYTYSVRKAELVSTYNGNVSLQNHFELEKVKSEQEEVQQDEIIVSECPEFNIDVIIEKTDILVDSPNDSTYTDTIEDDNNGQKDSLYNNKIDFEESSSFALNLVEQTNIEAMKIISHDHGVYAQRAPFTDAPPIKRHKTNETKPQHRAPECSGNIAANCETSTPLNSTPSLPDKNEMRVARPLYTYSISKVDVVSTYNGNISLKHEIKVEEVDLEVDEVQLDDLECNSDVDIEKMDLDEQTNYYELISPIDNTYSDIIKDNNDRLTDPLYKNKIDFEKTNSLALNLYDDGNIETTIKNKIISPHDSDAHPTKKRKANENKPQNQAPTTSTEAAANSETYNDITLLESSPSQLDNIRHINTKEKPTFGKNNRRSTVKEKNEINTCNYKTKLKQNIKTRHFNRNTDVKQFVFDICDYKTEQKGKLKRHMRTHTGEKQFSCEICHYECAVKSSLVRHMRTHTGEKPFWCDICHYKCAVKSNLVIHIMRTHTGKKPFSCEICHYKCADKSSLVLHMTTHTGVQQFSCEICHYKYAVKRNLVRHMRSHTGEKPFCCEICGYKCARKHYLVEHMRTHTGEKPFWCEICHYKCAVKSGLVRHMRTHTGEKPFWCEICNYKCAVKSYLVKHMRTHTGEKPFCCEICHYKCADKRNLQIHMRTHTGEKQFSCEICHYKCAVKSSLVIHMRTHTGEKPFWCEICNYKCAVKSHLVIHMRTHTGEKQFSCEICHYKCAVKSSLVMHMRTHTGEKPFWCEICNYKCARKYYLVEHMRTHTGEK